MKQINLLLAFLVFLPLSALADEESSSDVHAYFGLKVGQFFISIDEAESVMTTGFFGGLQFNESSSVEVEALNSEESTVVYGYYSSGSMKIKTTAIYYAYKSASPLYFKYRIGLLNEKVTGEGLALDAASDSGLSLGLGGGYDFGSVVLDVSYTLIEADVNSLSLGFAFEI